MAVYVYGVARDAPGAVGGAGIGGAPLSRVTAGALAALVSELPDGALRLGPDDLLAHGRALEELSARETVLPMRFGLTMEDAEDVRERLLRPFGDELAAQIEAFEGRVEVELRVMYDERRLLAEVVREHPAIARERVAQRGRPAAATHFRRIELGRLVAEAVERSRVGNHSG